MYSLKLCVALCFAFFACLVSSLPVPVSILPWDLQIAAERRHIRLHPP